MSECLAVIQTGLSRGLPKQWLVCTHLNDVLRERGL